MLCFSLLRLFLHPGGPQKLLSGSSTFGILATSLQLVGNEMRVLKVRYLAEGKDNRPDIEVGSSGMTAAPTTSSLRKAVHTSTERTATALPASLSPPTGNQTASDSSTAGTTTSTTPQSATWLQRATSYISSLSPVTKLSDEEYADQLRDRRKQVLERMAAIEEMIAQDSRTEKQV